MAKVKFNLRLYPFLVGSAPILILFAGNLGEAEPSEVWRSFGVVLLLTAILLLTSWLIFRHGGKAGLWTSVVLIVLLAYGHMYDGLKQIDWLVPFARHRFLLALNLLLIAGFGWLLWKKIKHPEALESFFTWFSIFLLVFPLYKIGNYYLFSSMGKVSPNAEAQDAALVSQSAAKPDIYYIILDGYGREDILKDLYAFDNSEFVNELAQLGFYVAPQATSNYPQTLLSLSSSLNFQYVDDTLLPIDASSNDRRPLVDRIHHSRMRQIMQENGYTFVAFDTGFVTSVEDADIYYKYRASQNEGKSFFLSLNSFEGLLLEQTLIRPLIDVGLIDQKYVKDTLEAPYIRHRGRTLFAFEKLAEIPKMEGDYFVFAHIVAPHPPFVFGKNGEMISHTGAYTFGDTAENAAGTRNGTRAEYIQGYTDQMTYVNGLVLKTVKTLLSESQTPPIIIIQGDHGPGAYLDWTSEKKTNVRDRFSILNAYYLAGRQSSLLYPSISPVNTFRVVLDEFFDAQMKLLPDRSFFALWETPFQLEEVTGEVTGK